MLLQVLKSVGAYTVALDYYGQGKPGALSLAFTVSNRKALQHQLARLPPGQELEDTSTSKVRFYESCRITLHIFWFALVLQFSLDTLVFDPTTDAESHLQILVTRLKM